MAIIGICNDDKEIESFTQKLEKKAREALVSPGRQSGYLSLSSLIQDDIALILNQIDQLRTRGKEIKQSLLQSECDIETELMQMEERTPRYSPYRFPEREKLQRRLGHIAVERRQFTMTLAEKLDSFHDRLLSLMKKHRQLKPR